MPEDRAEIECRINAVVAGCNNDAWEAIRALLIVNERLEHDLQSLYEVLRLTPLQPDDLERHFLH